MPHDARPHPDLRIRSRATLVAEGMSRREIDAIAEHPDVVRAGSWLCHREAPPDIVAALASGGRPTCVTSLRQWGVWTAPFRGVHVAFRRGVRPPGAAPSAHPDAAITIVEHSYLRAWDGGGPLIGLEQSLLHAARCVDTDDLAILLESTAHLGLLGMSGIETLLERMPVLTRRDLGAIDPRAESGTETRVRRFVRSLGVAVEPQVQLLPDVRVDLLVGDALVIECDSRAHHTSREAYANDRRRDAELLLRGYRVMRLTWEDVMLRWEVTKERIRTAIRERLHRIHRRGRLITVPHGVRL